MSLRFRYKQIPVRAAVWTLGGRFVRPRALIHVAVIGPAGTDVWLAHVDSGSDETVFPESVAARIGIDLSHAPTGLSSVVGGQTVQLRFAEVLLRITDGCEQREWPARIALAPARLRYPLLGFAGCLQYFTAVLRGDQEEFELAINSLRPGI